MPLDSLTQITGRQMFKRDSYKDKDAYSIMCGCKASIMVRYPVWGFMAMDLVLVECSDVIPTMATDGFHIFYNPSFTKSLTTEEVRFVIAHEIYHCVWGHVNSSTIKSTSRVREDYDTKLWNIATDLFINYDLINSAIGLPIKNQFKGDHLMLGGGKAFCDEKFEGMSSEEIYEAIKDDEEYTSQAQTLDTHIEVVEDPSVEGEPQVDIDENGNITVRMSPDDYKEQSKKWKDTAVRAVGSSNASGDSANSAGDIPSGLKIAIGNLTKPKVSWKPHVRNFIRATRTNGYSYIKPSNKNTPNITLPSYRRDSSILELAFAIDTSGSMSHHQISNVISELAGILAIYPKFKIHVFCFDGEVNKESYKVITGNPRNMKNEVMKYVKSHIFGGGGTNFKSIWDFMDKMKISTKGLIVCTDGYPYSDDYVDPAKKGPYPIFLTIGNHNNWQSPVGKTLKYEDS